MTANLISGEGPSLQRKKSDSSAQDPVLQAYLGWVDAWISSYKAGTPMVEREPVLSLEELIGCFKEGGLGASFPCAQNLDDAVHAFQYYLHRDQITLTLDRKRPSDPLLDVLSQNYDPRAECNCEGTYPVPKGMDIQAQSECQAVKNTVAVMQKAIAGEKQWNSPKGLFTPEKLQAAVFEVIHANADERPAPQTCQGSDPAALIPEIQAPDRRPDSQCDSDWEVFRQLYPTAEQVKLCADAKHLCAIACGGSLINDGLARAVADAGNDILVGDYCEAADEKTISLLQRMGGAAVAFLKLCNLAGQVTDWQFQNLVACIIQCRVLGFYRDHARSRLPGGLYGSRMTGLVVHRHIDTSIYFCVLSASIATGEHLTEEAYMRLSEVCTLINDLTDLRGDTKRKQRENTVLRGIRGSVCDYLDGLIMRCLLLARKVIQSSKLSALVVLGYINWAVMASHHKIYELVHGVRSVKRYSACAYKSIEDSTPYDGLLKALEPYGSLGEKDAPNVFKKRVDMDGQYYKQRATSETQIAWMADIARSFLDPTVLRKVVDVVHWEWHGDVGDVEFCP